MFSKFMSTDRISALLFLLFCLAYAYQTTEIMLFPGDEYEPFTARTLPFALAIIGTILSLLLLITAKPDEQSGIASHFDWKLLIAFLILMALYGLTWLGFVIATGGFLMGGFYLLGERKKSILFGASFPFSFSFYLLLTQGLDIYLESGYIFNLF